MRRSKLLTKYLKLFTEQFVSAKIPEVMQYIKITVLKCTYNIIVSLFPLFLFYSSFNFILVNLPLSIRR